MQALPVFDVKFTFTLTWELGSNTLPSTFSAELSQVYRKFVQVYPKFASLIYTISTLLFLVVRKATSREHKLRLSSLIISPRSLHNL